MAKIIRVLKPFVFSTRPVGGTDRAPPVERKFTVGDHEIDDGTAAHPWIAAGADGKIESAEAALARITAEKVKADELTAANETARIAAERALEQLEKRARTADKIASAIADIEANPEAPVAASAAAKDELQKNLDTPVSELRAKQAAGTKK
jgi:hypothetical protein